MNNRYSSGRRKSILTGAAALLMGSSASVSNFPSSNNDRKAFRPQKNQDNWRRCGALKSSSSELLKLSRGGPSTPPSKNSPAVSRNSSARSTSRPGGAGNGTKKKKLCCDKCDNAHETADCPFYKKGRDKHPDAQRRRHHDFGESGGNFVLKSARVVKQPGDGSCLFHSMAYGLRKIGVSSVTATQLRRQIAQFVERNATMKISESPLGDWVKWDTGMSVRAYARRMMTSNYWGGGIEIASAARMNKVNVHVYEVSRRQRNGFKRISCFNVPGSKSTIHVLYTGGIHYDALCV